jgi:hypothetical protein
MLNWFAENPARYWWLVCFAITWTLFILLRPLLRPDWRDVKRTDWRWSLIILGVLFVGRWPTWFVTRQLNPDESMFIAGAITLRHDPVFWRSVDGTTSGPLNYYVLLPAGWIHGSDDYFSARVTALLLIAAALIFAHQAIAVVYGRQVARVTGFAALCFEALTTHTDFLHYSSELMPMCLLAAALYLAVQRFMVNAGWQWNAVGGLLLGAMPLAKLQAMPPAVLLGLGWIAGELWLRDASRTDQRRGLAALGAGAGLPLLACAILLTATSQWRHALISYVWYNTVYVDAAYLEITKVLALTWRMLIEEDSMPVAWLSGGGLWLLLSLPLPRVSTRPARLVAGAAVALCIASLVCILVPRRPFVHYWQLFVVPWTLLLGGITGQIMLTLENRGPLIRSSLLCAALLCTAGGLLYVRAGTPHPEVGRLMRYQTASRGAVAKVLGRYAQPGEALGMWGWMSSYYVETKLHQATREAHSYAEITDCPYRDYFRRRYLADLQRSAPPVFVDAVGPGNFYFQSRRFAPEAIFPELAAYLRAHYSQVAELQGSRIYVRKDRLAASLQ